MSQAVTSTSECTVAGLRSKLRAAWFARAELESYLAGQEARIRKLEKEAEDAKQDSQGEVDAGELTSLKALAAQLAALSEASLASSTLCVEAKTEITLYDRLKGVFVPRDCKATGEVMRRELALSNWLSTMQDNWGKALKEIPLVGKDKKESLEAWRARRITALLAAQTESEILPLIAGFSENTHGELIARCMDLALLNERQPGDALRAYLADAAPFFVFDEVDWGNLLFRALGPPIAAQETANLFKKLKQAQRVRALQLLVVLLELFPRPPIGDEPVTTTLRILMELPGLTNCMFGTLLENWPGDDWLAQTAIRPQPLELDVRWVQSSSSKDADDEDAKCSVADDERNSTEGKLRLLTKALGDAYLCILTTKTSLYTVSVNRLSSSSAVAS